MVVLSRSYKHRAGQLAGSALGLAHSKLPGPVQGLGCFLLKWPTEKAISTFICGLSVFRCEMVIPSLKWPTEKAVSTLISGSSVVSCKMVISC